VLKIFPMFEQEEVEGIYKDIRGLDKSDAGRDRENVG